MRAEMLSRVPLFSSLTQRQLDDLAREAELVSAPAGALLATQGRPGEELFVLLSGSAVVRRNNRRIAQLGPGDFFGEMSLIDGGLRSASVGLNEPADVLVLRRSQFRRLLAATPRLAEQLLITMAHRLREADQKLIS